MKVKPSKPDLIVRDPKTRKPLPAEGIEVNILETYWHKRLVCGDVVEVNLESRAVQKPEKAKKKEGV